MTEGGSTPRILIIAGSDSGGGAGIQADIKTVTMLGGHAMTALTAITAQNTLGVEAVEVLLPAFVVRQMACVAEDLGVDVVKIGMIGSADTVNAVADELATGLYGDLLVFDPVMVATSGSVLADERTIAAMERLARRSTLITPNLPELAALTGRAVATLDEALAAAQDLALRAGTDVLVKGGHAQGVIVTDCLVGPDGEIARWSNPRIDTPHAHGTGCTLASAIATGLGAGMTLPAAVGHAIGFVRASLKRAPGLGQGHGPMGQQFATGFGVSDARR